MTAATADRQAEMAALVRAHQAGVWRYLRFLGCDPAEADDLTQEAFLVVLRGEFEVRSPAQTAAYLRTVARNRLLMDRRKQRSRPEVVDLEAAEAVWAEVAGDDGMDGYLAALGECLQKAVSPRVRRALELQYRDKAARAEIATQLDLAVEGVKTLLRRARTALRECVQRRLGQ
ncbi:MAG TPA: sigma-70 family RNA polymerase sigma factor [Thermoguttaceae bacterium]|nr:sigma-70 family RNA polymerase sigma factor [Thermoguttaceae bacterium]